MENPFLELHWYYTKANVAWSSVEVTIWYPSEPTDFASIIMVERANPFGSCHCCYWHQSHSITTTLNVFVTLSLTPINIQSCVNAHMCSTYYQYKFPWKVHHLPPCPQWSVSKLHQTLLSNQEPTSWVSSTPIQASTQHQSTRQVVLRLYIIILIKMHLKNQRAWYATRTWMHYQQMSPSQSSLKDQCISTTMLNLQIF